MAHTPTEPTVFTWTRNARLNVLGRKTTGLINRLDDEISERRLRVRTGGRKESLHPGGNRFETLHYSTYRREMRLAGVDKTSSVVDLGSGAGRCLVVARQFGVARVHGIEIDDELNALARSNLERQKNSVPFELVSGDAASFDFSGISHVFMFNPFGEETLNRVLDRVEAALRETGTPITLSYVHPVLHETICRRSSVRLLVYQRPTGLTLERFDIACYRFDAELAAEPRAIE
jgi:hypothetical protein